MLKVWGRRSSLNVQKVMRLVGEIEMPHQHIPANGTFGGLDDPAFLRMNPHGPSSTQWATRQMPTTSSACRMRWIVIRETNLSR
jgi:hypothetical protein